MFIPSMNYVTERKESGDKNTGGTSWGMVQKKPSRAYIYSEKWAGVNVKDFVVRYKCPALRRPKKEGTL